MKDKAVTPITVISLGSNKMGYRMTLISDALSSLFHDFSPARIVCASGFYQTSAINTAHNPYMNCVIGLRLPLPFSKKALKDYRKELELMAGRLPESKSSGIMPLDVDLISWHHIPFDLPFSAPSYLTAPLLELMLSV